MVELNLDLVKLCYPNPSCHQNKNITAVCVQRSAVETAFVRHFRHLEPPENFCVSLPIKDLSNLVNSGSSRGNEGIGTTLISVDTSYAIQCCPHLLVASYAIQCCPHLLVASYAIQCCPHLLV